MRVLTGLDQLARSPHARRAIRGHAALLCNATTISRSGLATADAIAALRGLRLERIFSPQHGFAAEKQDNMIASGDGVHARLGVPITSLYGARRELAPEALKGIDVLIIDLQDVGTRVYTFLVTALLAMRTAKACGVPVVLLDRPNPIGGAAEGPLLTEGFRSFVGIVDVPLRHGLTAAEYCLYGAWRLGLLSEAEACAIATATRAHARTARRITPRAAARHISHWVHIVPMRAWCRSMLYNDTNLLWTMPSPNMPSPATALVYPGQVILEGTNLSEGRGTTRPFELFGAPHLQPDAILHRLAGMKDHRGGSPLTGVLLRAVAYEPTFHKFSGECVQGLQIHTPQPRRVRPVHLTIALLRAIRDSGGVALEWRPPPYEYEYDRLPVDLICGTDSVRLMIDAGASLADMTHVWEPGLRAYRERVRQLLLYEG